MQHVTFSTQRIMPSKIVCVGRNYAAHVAELNNETPDRPVLFIKPNSAIADVPRALPDELLHYESEITLLVLGRRIAGVGLGLDLTKRALQEDLKARGLPWERAKAFDGSAVFSDFVPCDGDTTGLHLEMFINDRRAQSGGVTQMLVKPQAILSDVASVFTLEDGDLIMTGTPHGVGAVVAGDRYRGMLFDGERLLLQTDWVVEDAVVTSSRA